MGASSGRYVFHSPSKTGSQIRPVFLCTVHGALRACPICAVTSSTRGQTQPMTARSSFWAHHSGTPSRVVASTSLRNRRCGVSSQARSATPSSRLTPRARPSCGKNRRRPARCRRARRRRRPSGGAPSSRRRRGSARTRARCSRACMPAAIAPVSGSRSSVTIASTARRASLVSSAAARSSTQRCAPRRPELKPSACWNANGVCSVFLSTSRSVRSRMPKATMGKQRSKSACAIFCASGKRNS